MKAGGRRFLFWVAVFIILAAAAGGERWNMGAFAEPFDTSSLTMVGAKGRFTFTVEMAVTWKQRRQGLQGRTRIAPDAGMLFDFQHTQPVSMWMKNTYLPLDMLFIAADGRIVNIAEHTVPQSLTPIHSAEPVRAVLEVSAGTSRRLGIVAGDKVIHPIFTALGE